MSKVNVYSESGEVVARVEYNSNLDFYDGSNYTCGSTGRHQGLTKLKDGRYVLIHGTEWEGERNTAEVVTADEALQAILSSDNDELLEESRFSELKAMSEDMTEEDDEE
jgi:hypothetical protein